MTEMLGELILIRHGKAEPRGETADDAQRKLTKNGIEDFNKILPELKSRLNPELEPRLCSSPLLRALQTAEIIADHLGINEIDQLDWIADGSYTGLQEKLKTLAPSSALVIVGHEPDLSEWSRELCGFSIPFRKGTAAGFRILSAEPLRAEPIWMILPETVDPGELNIKRSQPVIRGFQKILRIRVYEIFRTLRTFLDDPDDPETAHQFRVKIRTFRSLLSFIKPQLDDRQYEHVQDQTEKLFRRTGRLREIDIITTAWTKLLETHPELTRPKSVLTAVLKSERQKEQKEICGNAAGMLSGVFDLWNWVETGLIQRSEAPAPGGEAADSAAASEAEEPDMYKTGEKRKAETLEEFSKKRIGSWMKKAKVQLKAVEYSDITAIHDLRIRLKKLRYTLNTLEPQLHLESKDMIAKLSMLQDKLGAYCDIERNLSILNEFNAKYASRGIRYESGILGGYQVRMSEEKLDEIIKIIERRRQSPAS